MKIKVEDLEPNPFRKMATYPIDRAKIKALKASIREKTFWDNILVRKDKGKFQLAYGHHRWIALKELGIKDIDVPVRDIDDATMVKIMAEENLGWSTAPKIIIQTIQTAKEFLDGELAKYETWEDACAEEIFSTNFPNIHNAKAFAKLKQQKVGRDTLIKFLGDNWTAYYVQTALDIIKNENVDKEAIGKLPKLKAAIAFTKSVDKFTKVTGEKPKATVQRKVAEKLSDLDISKSQIYENLITEQYPGTGKRTVPQVDFSNYVSETADALVRLSRKLTNIRQVTKKYPNEQIPEEMYGLLDSINTLAMELREFGGELKSRKTQQKLLTQGDVK